MKVPLFTVNGTSYLSTVANHATHLITSEYPWLVLYALSWKCSSDPVLATWSQLIQIRSSLLAESSFANKLSQLFDVNCVTWCPLGTRVQTMPIKYSAHHDPTHPWITDAQIQCMVVLSLTLTTVRVLIGMTFSYGHWLTLAFELAFLHDSCHLSVLFFPSLSLARHICLASWLPAQSRGRALISAAVVHGPGLLSPQHLLQNTHARSIALLYELIQSADSQ